MSDNIRNRSGWTVVAAAFSLNLVFGVLYAWSVIGKALVKDLEWSRTDAALPFTVSSVAFAITMIFAGRLQDKAGPRITIILGGIMLGLGLALSGLALTPMMLLVTFGIIGGMGIGLGYSATTPPALKWFPPTKKGLIAGLVVSGVGLAPVYISPLTAWLLKIGGISKTFFVLGVGTLVIVLCLSLLLKNPPPGFALKTPQATASGAPAISARRDVDWSEMIGSPQFWLLWLTMALTASAGLMVIAHLATIADKQAAMKWGFMAVAMLALFNSSGRLVAGFFSDKLGRSRTMVLFFVLQAVNMFLFRYYTTPSLLLFGAAFTGVCYGTIFPLFPATTADFYGMKNLGVNYGFVFTAFGVAGTVGPIMAGKIADKTGSYNTAYIVCGIMLLVGAGLALMLRTPKLKDLPSSGS
ncbi:oxalate:formate antiporter [candidate division BRC1 bacterium HGW-BRC1-1]|nr:MAG: oxalate:formate antiporter [candidate division BRC1 bacterium HGW-BRC1-1]